MSIPLDNDLPEIVLQAGTNDINMISFLCHLDLCTAMNTGNLLLHRYIMMQHPEIIAEYCQYDDSNPFQPICLQVAI